MVLQKWILVLRAVGRKHIYLHFHSYNDVPNAISPCYYTILCNFTAIYVYRIRNEINISTRRKVKFSLSTPWIHRGEERYSSTHSEPRCKKEVSDQHHIPCCFTSGKEPQYSSNGRLGGPCSPSTCSGEEKNLLPPPGFDPWVTIPTNYEFCTLYMVCCPATVAEKPYENSLEI